MTKCTDFFVYAGFQIFSGFISLCCTQKDICSRHHFQIFSFLIKCILCQKCGSTELYWKYTVNLSFYCSFFSITKYFIQTVVEQCFKKYFHWEYAMSSKDVGKPCLLSGAVTFYSNLNMWGKKQLLCNELVTPIIKYSGSLIDCLPCCPLSKLGSSLR